MVINQNTQNQGGHFMKNKFKKAIASAMAVASLATCITGMNASAATGYRYLSEGTGCLSVTSTFVYASTSSGSVSYKEVSITDTTPTAPSLPVSKSGYYQTVSVSINGSFTHAWSSHKAGTSGTLSVSL